MSTKSKRERVKNPNPRPHAEPVRERVKAGPPGNPAALPGGPEGPDQKRPAAKKTAAPAAKK